MQIILNGERRTLEEPMTVRRLLEELQLDQSPVAVEINRCVVPRARHEETQIADGDRIEVVHFVGGG